MLVTLFYGCWLIVVDIYDFYGFFLNAVCLGEDQSS